MFSIIPWDHYALITELASRLAEKPVQFGKTSLQKILFILQEGYGVKCGYDFTLYNYGPYCVDVTIDLDQTETLGGVTVVSIYSGTGGYQLKPGSKTEDLKKRAQQFLLENREKIDHVIETFGTMNARELELRATLLFAANEAKDNHEPISVDSLYSIIKSIKPKYSDEEIYSGIDDIQRAGLVKWGATLSKDGDG
ncbi:hypothetical protein QA601_03915 [Chitinispirillales bacterium ANBcel5]|uniref:hypothetical protein n=1 Tax=Cellulosispirillum alkaliphilum TaxID=3039283 RepID=UPI002A4FE084|nr:hypothetical protein [Chitinispirillales bacterium ANBcel5]